MARTAAAIKAEIKTLRDKQESEIKKYDGQEMPESAVEEIRGVDVKLAALLEEHSDAATHERTAASNREALKSIFAPENAAQPTTDGDKTESKSALDLILSPGDIFISDRQFKSWLDQVTAGGTKQMPSGMSVKGSPSVDINKSIHELKAVITGLSSTSGGALVVNERTNYLVPAVRDDIRVVDLLTRQSTQSDTVEYVRVTTETNAAAPTLEATSVSTGAKPESSVAFAVVTAIVETIAHYINITRRAAADAGQLRGYVNDFLMWGLLDILNDQIINGTGSTPQLQGIDDLSNTQSQAFSTNLLETTRKALTLAKVVGGSMPTAYVMNPLDWEDIDLLQDNEARYMFGGPQRMGTPVLWGLPVIQDSAVTEGLAFVGDWRMGIVWDREQARILMTDSHDDLFIRNILTLLAEMRVAIGWLRPAAFVEIDLTA